MDRIGKTLKMYRLRHGLTQEQLGKLVDYSAAMISQIEDGLKSPSLDKAQDLAIQLGLSLSELVGDAVPLHTVTNQAHGDHTVIQNIDGRYCGLTDTTGQRLLEELRAVWEALEEVRALVARLVPEETSSPPAPD